MAGSFDLDNRRRMTDTEEGRRQLNAATANAMFDFFDDQEDFECSRQWFNESYMVEPRSPKKPYFYAGLNYIACWEPDEDLLKEEDDDTEGSTQRCFSKYGPTAGQKLPGVIEDSRGLAAVSVQYSLVTENRTIVISRYPSHPLQMHVQIEDESNSLENSSNAISFDFQVHDALPLTRQFCSMDVGETVANNTFEDSFLSFLGMRDNLRHWSIGNEDGEKLVDYFDTNDNHEPHSIHMGRGTKEFTEFRYTEFEEELDDASIESWLARHFADSSVYDLDDWTHCEKWDMVKDAATGMDSMEENLDNVDLYSKELLDHDIDHDFSQALKETSFAAYWEAVRYQRREAIKRDASTDEIGAEPDIDLEEEIFQGQEIEFDDPYFWRELATISGWDADTPEQEITDAWYDIVETYGDDDYEDLYELGDVVSAVSNRTGLTMDELMTVLAPVTYEAKGVVVNATSTHFAIDKLRYVVQGETSSHFDAASMATDGAYIVFDSDCGTVYKVTTDGDDVTVGLVTAEDDPDTSADEETVGPNVDITGLPDGTLAFVFYSYTDANDDTCDPAKPLPDPDGNGRRLQYSEDTNQTMVPLFEDTQGQWWAGDRSGGQQHRRRLTAVSCGLGDGLLGVTLSELSSSLGIGRLPSWLKYIVVNHDYNQVIGSISCSICADQTGGTACHAKEMGSEQTWVQANIKFESTVSVGITLCSDNRNVVCSFSFSMSIQDIPPMKTLAEALSLDEIISSFKYVDVVPALHHYGPIETKLGSLT